MIKGLHHNAYRCRDSGETREFYEDFLGLPLAGILEINETMTGRETKVLHTFLRWATAPTWLFSRPRSIPSSSRTSTTSTCTLRSRWMGHPALQSMFEKGKAEGVDTRGVIDHGFVNSIYFRDPNGYVIELTAKTGAHDDMMDPEKTHPRQILDRWQAAKTA